jgi:hypothetical protein
LDAAEFGQSLVQHGGAGTIAEGHQHRAWTGQCGRGRGGICGGTSAKQGFNWAEGGGGSDGQTGLQEATAIILH